MSAKHQGIVKSILSGDTVIIRGQPRNGPPPERTLSLAHLTAPRPARRPQGEATAEAKDEPLAWESREFLRRKLVGKAVTFYIEYAVPSGREYGTIIVDEGTPAEENISKAVLREGFAKIREGARAETEDFQALVTAQQAAQTAKKGLWADDVSSKVRNITWAVENPRALVESLKGQAVDAIVEQVRDGCTIRAFLLPKMQYVTVMLSGVRTPVFKRGEDGKEVAEPFAGEAKFFVESRLLQREVKVILEGVSDKDNFIGSVVHPKAGNIAEFILAEGLGKIVDWTLGQVTGGPAKLRAAETAAKQKQLRVWKGWKPNESASLSPEEKKYTAVVEEVVNAETLVVRVGEESRKIFLSSIRQPKAGDVEGGAAAATGAAKPEKGAEGETKSRSARMWEVPAAFEAREFLRKKLIGEKVQIVVDYIKPASDGYEAKTCATVLTNGLNVAEVLVSKGLATVVRHRQDDDSRSSAYDALLAADAKAKKSDKGIYAKVPSTVRISEVTTKAQADRFFPSLQRAGRAVGILEHVANGGRYRVYFPKDSCVVTVVLAGLSCPRPGRDGAPDEPFSKEATSYVRRRALQRDVEIEVEDVDKTGCMVGHVYVQHESLAVGLLQAGYAKLHPSYKRYRNSSLYAATESEAKDARRGAWASYVEPTPEELAASAQKEIEVRKEKYLPANVTHISGPISFWAQTKGAEQMDKINEALGSFSAPGGHVAKKGDLVAAKFTADDAWYRARVLSARGDEIELLYVDFGNGETTSASRIAALPFGLADIPAQASEFTLAFVDPPVADYEDEAMGLLADIVLNKPVLYNVEYSDDGKNFVSVTSEDGTVDAASELVLSGFAVPVRRREAAFKTVLASLNNLLKDAKENHYGMWVYGDPYGDDPRDFGTGKKF